MQCSSFRFVVVLTGMSKRKSDTDDDDSVAKRQRVSSSFRVQPTQHDMLFTHPNNLKTKDEARKTIQLAMKYLEQAKQQEAEIQSKEERARLRERCEQERKCADDDQKCDQQTQNDAFEKRVQKNLKTVQTRKMSLRKKFREHFKALLLQRQKLPVDLDKLSIDQQICLMIKFIENPCSNIVFYRTPNLVFKYKCAVDVAQSTSAPLPDDVENDKSKRPVIDKRDNPIALEFSDIADDDTEVKYNTSALADLSFKRWKALVCNGISDKNVRFEYVSLAAHYCRELFHLSKFQKMSDGEEALKPKTVETHMKKYIKLLWLELYRALDANRKRETAKLESKIRESVKLSDFKPRKKTANKKSKTAIASDDADGDADPTKKNAVASATAGVVLQQQAQKEIQKDIQFFERFNKLVHAETRQNFNSDDDTRQMRILRARYYNLFPAQQSVRALALLIERGCAWLGNWPDFPEPLT